MSLIDNKYIHLTNIDINKYNRNFIKPNKTSDGKANTWNIMMYKKYLRKYNIKWSNIRNKIKDIIIKTIISVYNNLIEENIRQNLSEQSFYNILGFDILITNEFKPILIEVNKNPSMLYLNNLDMVVKNNLIIDTLNLIGIIPFSKKTEEPLNYHAIFNLDHNENINNALCELERIRGDYELIFPTKKNIHLYKKYFTNNNDENKKFWNLIIRHK